MTNDSSPQSLDEYGELSIKIFRYFLIVIVFCFFSAKLFGEKGQLWLTALQPLGEINKIVFSFRQQYRLEFNWKLVDARFSIYSKKKLTDHLDGEIHFTLINIRERHESAFEQRYRGEFELNPHINLTKKIELKLRNRYELIKREHDPILENIFRQRQQIVMKIENCQPLQSISIHNELFWNINRGWRLEQCRFVPLEFTFGLGKKHSYKINGMMRWLKTNEWNSQLVLGFEFNW